MKTILKFSWLVAGLIGLSGVVSAQDIPPNFRASDPLKTVEKGVREESESQARSRKETPIPAAQQKERLESTGLKTRFVLKEVKFQGNVELSAEDLRPVIGPYQGREVTIDDLLQLTRNIEQEYRQRGFTTSLAYLPPQQVQQGMVTIIIIEGRVGQLSVEGNRYFRKKRILSYARFKQGDPLKQKKLRQTLYDLNQNPDRTVRAVLKPGAETGASDIILHVKDSFPIHGGFFWDNQGVENSGKQRYGFTLRDNNLLGLDDILLGGFIFGKNFGAVFTQYILPIPSTRTQIVSGFTHSQVTPKKEVAELGVNGTSQTYFTRIEQALWDFNWGPWAFSTAFHLGFDFIESRTKVLSGTFSRERLRVLRFGPSMRMDDKWGFATFAHEFSFGINGLGAMIFADPSASRQGVEPDFFKYHVNFSRHQRMFWGTRASLHLEAQVPSNKLPSQEALYLGGASTVRGYPEGDYLADMGLLVNLEYFIPFFIVPGDWQLPYSDIPLRRQIEIVMFMDQGYGRLRGPSSRETLSRKLMSVGGGLRIRLYKDLYGRTEWAYALGDHPLTDDRRHQFHFRLQFEV